MLLLFALRGEAFFSRMVLGCVWEIAYTDIGMVDFVACSGRPYVGAQLGPLYSSQQSGATLPEVARVGSKDLDHVIPVVVGGGTQDGADCFIKCRPDS